MNPPKYIRETNNDPWAILIALASLIVVATGTAIFVLIVLWKKYQKNRLLFERNFIGVSYELVTPTVVPVRMPSPVIHAISVPQPLPVSAVSIISEESVERSEYEDQTLDMFVPLEDRDDLGEVHIDFNAETGIQAIHHVKEVKTNSNTVENANNNNSKSIAT